MTVPEKDIFEGEAKEPLPDNLQLLVLEFDLHTMTRQDWRRRREDYEDDEDSEDGKDGYEKIQDRIIEWQDALDTCFGLIGSTRLIRPNKPSVFGTRACRSQPR
jgi:hypothetical protein